MENAALLSAIIENAIDGIITIDELGKVESINPSACRIFGYLPVEVIGENITKIMPLPEKGEDDEYLNNYKRREIAKMIGVGREVEGLQKDGTVFPFRLGLSQVQYSGRSIYTGFIHDLSKEKAAEIKVKEYTEDLELQVQERTKSLIATVKALEQAKEDVSTMLAKEKELGLLKSRFVSIASHEFRTPLTSIQLSASLIEQYAQPFESAPIRKHVAKIQNSVGNLTSILNDFLSLEKLESGKEVPTFDEFDLVQISEQITEEMQVMAKARQNIIYQHTGTTSMVKLDPNLLRCCIINLIANAIKYSGENTFIDFNTEIRPDVCIITIKDNGIGIPEVDQKHLFEAFFRAHNTGTIPGTGLGLNIVARYIDLMQGSVNFESHVNQGTIFTIRFPGA
jgi:two-component system sensor kinase FixL